MGNLKQPDISREEASRKLTLFDETDRKLMFADEAFRDLDKSGIKYSKIKELLAYDIYATQSILEKRVKDMEKRFGINFNDKAWIDSIDVLMAKEVGQFYRVSKEVESEAELDLMLELQQKGLKKSLKDLEKRVEDLFFDVGQQMTNYQKQLSEKEIRDFLLRTHKVLYEPLDYLEAIVATPEKEIQYEAYLSKNEFFYRTFPAKFKQLMKCMLNSADLRRNVSGFAGVISGLKYLILERRKARAPSIVDQKALDQVEPILTELEGLLKNRLSIVELVNKQTEAKISVAAGKFLVLMQKPELESFLEGLYSEERPEGRRLEIDPPEKFADFLQLVKVDREFRDSNGRQIEALLGGMDLDEDPLLSSNYILAYNSRKVTSIYCLISGISDAKEAFDKISKDLGERADDFFLDRNLGMDWSESKSVLTLRSKGRSVKIHIKKGESRDIFADQEVEQKPATHEEREAFAKHFGGEVELVDNALGEISDLTLIEVHTPRSVLIAVIRRFKGKKINIVTWGPLKNSERIKYEADFMRSLRKAGVENSENKINFVYSKQAKSVWARDYFLQAKDPKTGKRIFLESPKQQKLWERNVKMSEDIAKDSDIPEKSEYREFNLYFEGGDMRAVGSRLFMGEESFQKAVDQAKKPKFKITFTFPESLGGEDISVEGTNKFILERELGRKVQEYLAKLSGEAKDDFEFEQYLKQNINNGIKVETLYEIGGEVLKILPPDQEVVKILKREYEKYFGRELVIVGEGDEEKQAIFHIDMFVNFLPNLKGKPTVVIADTQETLQILSKLTPAELDDIEKTMVKSQMSAVDLETDKLMKSKLVQSDIRGSIHDYINELKSGRRLQGLQKRLDAVAKWFKDKGYDVVRIPTAIEHGDSPENLLTFHKPDYQGFSGKLNNVTENADRTYSNSIVETYVDEKGILQKIVYMPTFGISPVEKRVVEIYNSLGYRVVSVDNLIYPARDQGVLNCITSEYRK